jgi:NADH-quinone oxidoreductase subunit N
VIDFHAIAPELILAGTAVLVLVADLYLGRKIVANWLAIAGTAAAAVALVTLFVDGGFDGSRATFGGSFVVDGFALVFKALFLGSLLLVLLMSQRYIDDGEYYQGEYYFLLLSSFTGMLLMPSSRDLLMLFLSLEIVSATGFVIAGLRKGDVRSNEGALKFLLIGVLSTAVMLFGMSLVYGFTGAIKLDDIARIIAERGLANEPALVMSVFLVITGFAFKVSAAPFHFWAPDTYEGSPVPAAAYLSVASKAAGFAGLLLITFRAFPALAGSWAPALGVLAAITMLIGNVVALAQTRMVRLLAYSSVAQAGYMLVPFATAAAVGGGELQAAISAVVAYLVLYGVTNLGAFTVVTLIAQRQPGNQIADYDGLGRRAPALATTMTLFLFSLAGIPATSGFIAKLLVFRSALGAGEPWLNALAVFMGVMTVVSLFYYLSIVRRMWTSDAPAGVPARVSVPAPAGLAIALATAGVVILGILPGLLVDPLAPGSGADQVATPAATSRTP